MQRQHSMRGCYIGFHRRGRVRGKSIDHQMSRLRTVSHHPPQQLDEQFRVQPAVTGAVSEASACIHSGMQALYLSLLPQIMVIS